MISFLSVIYILVCLFLILVVLLQSGRGGGIGSAFGSSASQQIFGGAGAGNLLTRLTSICAFAFMTLSVLLSSLSSAGEHALDRAVQEREGTQVTQGNSKQSASEELEVLDDKETQLETKKGVETLDQTLVIDEPSGGGGEKAP